MPRSHAALCAIALFLTPFLFFRYAVAQTDRDLRLDKMLAAWNRADSPGVAVRVIQNGRPLLTRCYGLADLEHRVPITPTTVFDIASVSKQFCAFAIASLCEKKKLDLTADVRTYLPNALPHISEKVTLDHLVHHTSGLRDWPATLAVAGWRMDDVITFEQILELARHQRHLNFSPGTRYSYSNTGYNLLAATVAKVGGVSFREWTKRHIFDPLEMSDTHFRDNHTEVVARAARSYRRTPSGWAVATNNLTALGSSSLLTTLEDLTKWVANFETARVGGRAIINRLHERGVLTDGTTIDYAFGQTGGRYGGHLVWSHAGSWAGFRTVLVRVPEKRFSVLVLANASNVNALGLAARIGSLFDDRKPEGGRTPTGSARRQMPTSKPNDPPKLSRDALSRYAGRYWSEELDTAYDVAVSGPRLVLRHRKNGELPMTRTGEDRFSTQVWYARSVVFDRDRENEVTGLRISSGRAANLRFSRVRR